jgi:hypothetical protein
MIFVRIEPIAVITSCFANVLREALPHFIWGLECARGLLSRLIWERGNA